MNFAMPLSGVTGAVEEQRKKGEREGWKGWGERTRDKHEVE